jgi:O-antigen ligase
MQVLSLEIPASAENIPLPTFVFRRMRSGHQWLLGLIATILLCGLFFLTHSILVVYLFPCLFGLIAVIRNPVYSIYAFIVLNILLLLRLPGSGSVDAPGIKEIIAGLFLIGIIIYWIVRIRIFESEPLSNTLGQLFLVLFFGWSIPITIGGLFLDHHFASSAFREVLNLLPLLILPVLYERHIVSGSSQEKTIFFLILAGGCISIVWSILQMRYQISQAVYLFQSGRAKTDETLAAFLILLATSFLMSLRRSWKILPLVILWIAGWVGVIVTFSRALYVAALFTMILTIVLGTSQERRNGRIHVFWSAFVAASLIVSICLTSRLIRLLASHYFLRFLSTQHLGTDRSLLQRYTEWGYEWNAIKESPILGHGFGSQFKVYNMIEHFHSWMGFSHSSYLYLVFKTGFLGALLFLGAFFVFLYKGFKLLKSPTLIDPARSIVRACVTYMIVILIYAYAGPIFDSKTDLIWIGLIWGYFLALERVHIKQQLVTSCIKQDDLLA